jgi:hypothetical protein
LILGIWPLVASRLPIILIRHAALPFRARSAKLGLATQRVVGQDTCEP